ncbi:uncharacterized protein LOC127028046 [Gymnogyps californianus]|uniref:uncharacterized protein LOC127028046 n=1 Tax=Gymnogyps californianus TaxID=33616 RepID=UPI0021C6E169|nr:uncharacterized protein LOC127028046 [Gymnogyps californianus]
MAGFLLSGSLSPTSHCDPSNNLFSVHKHAVFGTTEEKLIVYPLRPGSSRRKKEAGRQEPAPPARPTSALPSSEACKRALQGVWELSEQWDEAEHLRSSYRDRVQKAQAEWAAWEAWSAGEHPQPPKELGTSGLWAPHPPAQPRSKEDKKRRRKAENPLPEEEKASAAQLKRLQPDNLSPRAAQVLKRLEPHQARQDIFKRVAEINRRKLEQQRQLPCARCSSCNRGEGARSSGCGSGAASKGAGRLPSCQNPPKNAK